MQGARAGWNVPTFSILLVLLFNRKSGLTQESETQLIANLNLTQYVVDRHILAATIVVQCGGNNSIIAGQHFAKSLRIVHWVS
jgi:hypothetical protein